MNKQLFSFVSDAINLEGLGWIREIQIAYSGHEDIQISVYYKHIPGNNEWLIVVEDNDNNKRFSQTFHSVCNGCLEQFTWYAVLKFVKRSLKQFNPFSGIDPLKTETWEWSERTLNQVNCMISELTKFKDGEFKSNFVDWDELKENPYNPPRPFGFGTFGFNW